MTVWSNTKGSFFSESTDAFVISSNMWTCEHVSLKIWNLVTEICLEIEGVLKFDSLEACKGKKVAIGCLAQP